jgi:hypothetical protein
VRFKKTAEIIRPVAELVKDVGIMHLYTRRERSSTRRPASCEGGKIMIPHPQRPAETSFIRNLPFCLNPRERLPDDFPVFPMKVSVPYGML